MSSQEELIAQFVEISGLDETVAKFYLSSHNWSLETALSNFLGNQGENENSESKNESLAGAASYPTESGSLTNADGSGSSSSFGKTSTGKPKFATLDDMTKRSSNEEEGQAFYAGGSERSGQQVLGPPKRRNFREQLTDMFRLAQDQNAFDAPPVASTSSCVNWGQGIRLGMSENDHAVVTSKASNDAEKKKPVVVLKLWRQGFSIDNGELRLYDDTENKEFLETVMRGEIPHELVEMGWMVNVDVEDHRHEDYKKTAVVKTFKGSGHALGSPVPDVEGASGSTVHIEPPKASNKDSVDDEKIAKEKLNLNTTEPTTTLQIRLEDGSRISAQFNLNHTVADIHSYIQNARPQYANRDFVLVSSFPTRELSDCKLTIEVAGLKNAAIMQRLK